MVRFVWTRYWSSHMVFRWMEVSDVIDRMLLENDSSSDTVLWCEIVSIFWYKRRSLGVERHITRLTLFLPFGLRLPLAWTIARSTWITLLVKPSGYCSLIEDHARLLEYSSVLPSIYLFAIVSTLPVSLTMSINKSLHMDPHTHVSLALLHIHAYTNTYIHVCIHSKYIHTYWQKCITWIQFKSFWIKASAKCINANVIQTPIKQCLLTILHINLLIPFLIPDGHLLWKLIHIYV